MNKYKSSANKTYFVSSIFELPFLGKLYFLDSDDDFEGEFRLEQMYTTPGCSIDATVRVRYKRIKTGRYGSPWDPIDIQLSLTNNQALEGPKINEDCEIDLPIAWPYDYRMKGMYAFFIKIIRQKLYQCKSIFSLQSISD